jgi:hypothetical protein
MLHSALPNSTSLGRLGTQVVDANVNLDPFPENSFSYRRAWPPISLMSSVVCEDP